MTNKQQDRKRASGTGAIINRPGTDKLYIRYWVNGKQKQEATGSTDPKVAEKMLRERLTDTERGAVAAADINRLTYEDLRDGYFVKNPDQRGNHHLTHIEDFFAGRKVVRITTDLIDEYIESRREDGVSDPTIRRELVCLRAMFHEARKKNKLGLRDVPYFSMPDDSDPAAQPITPEQFTSILKALEAIRQEKIKAEPQAHKKQPFGDLRPLFIFLYGTACRLGTAMALTYEMLSRDGKSIRVPGKYTKNGEDLTISLAGPFLADLSEQLRKLAEKTFDKKTTLLFDSTNYRREWAKAVARVGLGTWDSKKLTRTGVRIHDMRASAAVNLVNAGVPEAIVMKVAGWKDRKMLDRYVKLSDAAAASAMEKAGQHVISRMNGTK